MRQGQRRQSARYIADDLDAMAVQAEGKGQQSGHDDGGHGTGLGRHIRQTRRDPLGDQKRLQPFAHPEQKSGRGHADDQRDEIGLAQMLPNRHQPFRQGRSPGRHPQKMLGLRGGNQDARRGDKPGNDRVAEEIGKEPQTEDPHGQKDQTGQKCQCDRGGRIFGGALQGHIADSGGGHQRHHRDRAHGERARGAENCIGHQRQDRGVKPHFRRQPRQQRIGQRLRDQHNRHDQRSNAIIGKGRGGIAASPVQNGQVTAQFAGINGHWACPSPVLPVWSGALRPGPLRPLSRPSF